AINPAIVPTLREATTKTPSSTTTLLTSEKERNEISPRPNSLSLARVARYGAGGFASNPSVIALHISGNGPASATAIVSSSSNQKGLRDACSANDTAMINKRNVSQIILSLGCIATREDRTQIRLSCMECRRQKFLSLSPGGPAILAATLRRRCGVLVC